MASRRQGVKIRQKDIDALIKTYRSAYRDIIQTITFATEAGRIQKARVLATIKKTLQELGDEVDKWAKSTIPPYYLDGANRAIQDLRSLGVELNKTSGLAAVNKLAIEALVSDTSNALLEAVAGIQRNSSAIISAAVRQQTDFIIADNRLKGESLKTVRDNIATRLRNEGIDALQDSAGRSWKFDRYAEMLARTKIVEARNTGLANRMLQNGYDLVEVTDTGSTHAACARWEGKVLSLTGNTPGYPTLAEAQNDGIFHPNCQHAINVLQPELAEQTIAYENPYNYEKAQVLD